MTSFYGKIPPRILESIVFQRLGASRRDVVLGPSVGEDAAIVQVNEGKLVLSCDPISGALKRVGWLAVNVAANDVATRGAEPLWYLACVLLPKNGFEALLEEICGDMDAAAKRLNVSIVGGHSEITPGIDHPIIVGCCAGSLKGKRYFITAMAKPGSKIVLTKGAGVEGTAILAIDLKDAIVNRFGAGLAKRAERYLDLISVVPEAKLASSVDGVLAMHDPTEGGVAGGLNEMAEAAKCGFKVYEEKILVREETAKICGYLGLDPLKLISSGSLLIAVEEWAAEALTWKLNEIGVQSSIIGEFVKDPGSRTIVKANGLEEPLPTPESDEIWKMATRT